MIKRLVAILILIFLISVITIYFARQINWQDLGTVEYSLGAVSIPDFLPPPQITLLAVGDIMLDRGVELSVDNHGAGDFNFVFDKIKGLKSGADIMLGNLEGPVAWGGADGGGIYSFHTSPLILPVLKNLGFDVLSVANNHAADWGRTAFTETLDNLSKNNLLFVGGAKNYASATEPVIIEKNGLKVGFLGFSDVGPTALRATSSQAGILLASDPDFVGIINRASKKVDVLVITIHWGDEYKVNHNLRQENLAREAVLAGAKVIIGHHPHVIQDTEKSKEAYIAYSLGNFVFDQYFSLETMEGLALKLEINKDGVSRVEKKPIKINKWFQPSWMASSTESF
ncbi:MAG: CapA family protein [Candidatus Paceibacterota bacterium]|jgi:poly-gamma-glutamate synthesis protein (capsule biosynthesis protein)